jgi:type IV secretion system protein VirB10
MIDASLSAGRDPRLDAFPDDLGLADIRSAPAVGRPAGALEGLGLAIGLIGATALGGITIVSLAHQHAASLSRPQPAVTAPAAPRLAAAKPPVAASIAPLAPAVQAAAPNTPSVLVLDDSTRPPAPVTTTPVRSEPAGAAPAKASVALSPDEQFAAHAGDEPVPVSHLHKLDHPGQVITQGSVIPAVLETALNSDLPGYARALVSSDVRSFDGSRVLIPRGSRLVGQYKSAPQTGQTRMLIIWTRLLRPDGTSIQLASPVTDSIGEAGLTGKVDNHYLQRYGSAILLSVISGVASGLGGANNNTIVVGTTSQTSNVASVALQDNIKIPPTVRLMQGAAIQVFVARDLDFSGDAQ